MSDPSGPDGAQIVALYATATDSNWLEIAVAALLAYEYVITFDQEVALFWKRKTTGATALFLITRYLALLSYDFIGPASFARVSDQSCGALILAQYIAGICQYPFWAAFSALRALALSGMNWPLAAVVFALALVPLAMNIWPIALDQLSGMNVLTLGCGGGTDESTRPALIGVALSRSCFILSDMLVTIVTWRSWRRTVRNVVTASGAAVPTLSNVLMYNGTLYFLVLIVCNIVHLTLSILSVDAPLQQGSVVTALIDPLTAILICRFLLALQRANQAACERDTHAPGEDGAGEDTLRFASVVIGSIGESLEGADVGELDADASEVLGDDSENAEHPGVEGREGFLSP